MRFHEEVCYVAVAWDTMYLGLQLFGTSEEVVIKLRLGRLEPFSRGCDRMRASFGGVRPVDCTTLQVLAGLRTS